MYARNFWVVLSRLSFGVYLVFPVVQGIFASSMKDPLYLTYNEMLYQLIFSILMSFLGALLIWVFVEAPVKNMLKN